MNIKQSIKAHGWTLDALAKEMTNRDGTKGITQPSMSQLVNGNPTLDKLKEIAAIIGISVSELVTDTDGSGCAMLRCPHCGKAISVRLE